MTELCQFTNTEQPTNGVMVTRHDHDGQVCFSFYEGIPYTCYDRGDEHVRGKSAAEAFLTEQAKLHERAAREYWKAREIMLTLEE